MLKRFQGLLCTMLLFAAGSMAFGESGILQYVLAAMIGNTYTYVDTPTVESGRYMPFDTDWDQLVESNYTFSVDSGAWTGSGIIKATQGIRIPAGGTSPVYLIRSIEGSYIQSPKLQGGVGTIYYTSQLSVKNQSGRVLIQVSTNDAPGSSDWTTVKFLVYPRVSSDNYPQAEPVLLNRADVKFVRFYLDQASPYDTTSLKSNGAISFDNIAISKPWERITNTGLWGPDFAYPE